MQTVDTAFNVKSVQWTYSASREIRGDRMLPAPVRTGVQSMIVACNACGEAWKAIEGEGPGKYQPVIGALYLTCRGCNSSAPIAMSSLKQVG